MRITGTPQAQLYLASTFGRPRVDRPVAKVQPVGPPSETRRTPTPTALVLRRVEAADRAVARVGDLLDSLRQGFARNVAKADPERENRRLTDSASATVEDIVENTRVDGRRVFAGPVPRAVVPFQAYQPPAQDPPAVRRALQGVERSLRAVPEALKELRVGSVAEVETAGETIDRLESRMDSSRRSLLAAARPSGLDLQA